VSFIFKINAWPQLVLLTSLLKPVYIVFTIISNISFIVVRLVIGRKFQQISVHFKDWALEKPGPAWILEMSYFLWNLVPNLIEACWFQIWCLFLELSVSVTQRDFFWLGVTIFWLGVTLCAFLFHTSLKQL